MGIFAFRRARRQYANMQPTAEVRAETVPVPAALSDDELEQATRPATAPVVETPKRPTPSRRR
jgi:hypothetical protein